MFSDYKSCSHNPRAPARTHESFMGQLPCLTNLSKFPFKMSTSIILRSAVSRVYLKFGQLILSGRLFYIFPAIGPLIGQLITSLVPRKCPVDFLASSPLIGPPIVHPLPRSSLSHCPLLRGHRVSIFTFFLVLHTHIVLLNRPARKA